MISILDDLKTIKRSKSRDNMAIDSSRDLSSKLTGRYHVCTIMRSVPAFTSVSIECNVWMRASYDLISMARAKVP